jgi:hypothetical protein
VDPVPDPLLLRKSGNAGNRTQTSGFVAKTLITRPQRRSSSLADYGHGVCVNSFVIILQFYFALSISKQNSPLTAVLIQPCSSLRLSAPSNVVKSAPVNY